MNGLPTWARTLDAAFGPPLPGQYRAAPDDFIVEEQLDFTPEAHGEHLWLYIEKRNQTTLDVVKQLARLCGVTPRDMGYSGMKDRVAITRQWLSVHLPGRDAPVDLTERLAGVDVRVLAQARHPRKLKRGVHRTNRFTLRLSGEAVASDCFTARWQALCHHGVANYFGPQRFGPGGRNLARAEAVLARGWRKRDDRQGMLLSSARSFLFDEMLSARIEAGSWNSPLDGDTLMLDGTQSVFRTDQVDQTLKARAEALDIHPAGILWGVGYTPDETPAQRFEAEVVERHPVLCDGLLRSGIKPARRALRMRLGEPELKIEAGHATLTFLLPRGGFATAVLGELIAHPDVAGG
ncbi:tRNA pseudouridine(13) synthase TruD [Halomonas llamarensis]|uniref:tRNA pseudouridine synthase D n=1 Tax=Halomonas llamarensis TaxID=2945104 RepID=A0ABT0SP00_9GAMM|nr:tRNA pseudouridine(13) synthase TruD [Halomonas llamarensis]MCL7929467.1 tRNA pseudouridine(13) synthase TruD [Halomonas llamarensis]